MTSPRFLRALAAGLVAALATCAGGGGTPAAAQDVPAHTTTLQAPVKYPAVCLADSLKKSTTSEATKHQCAAIKAHVDSANAQLAVARTIKVTGPKVPPKPTHHPPHVVPPDSVISPVDTLTPPVAPVLSALAIVTQPGDAASGGALSPSPVVRFIDQFGALFNTNATITAARASGLATIGGTTTVSAVNGVAAFSTLTGTTVTTGANTLTFSAPGLPSITSAAFTVTAPPPPTPAPTIASFTASPSTISSAGNVTLSWSTSGATALSIAPAIGTVTGTTTATATVSATTTFTLTATNSGGTTTATTTVTLAPPGSLPPTPGVAELPRVLVDATYPTPTRSYRIAAGSNFQTALDTAKSGDLILTPPGATWVGNFILRKKGPSSSYITIRTDTSDAVMGAPGVRMTPTRAAAARLTKFQTATNNVPTFATEDSSHHWRLTGLDIGNNGVPDQLNMLVRFGDGASAGQTVFANIPAFLILDRDYIHASPTMELKRCLSFNSAWTAVVDSWLAECHGNGGEAQAINGYNGPGPFLIRNNHIEASHMAFMWGGADPFSAQFTPQDITVVYNHVTRPQSWRVTVNPPGTVAGQWQAKNMVEDKNVQRYLIQGNVIENVWADAQAGFAFVMKSENQQGTAPYTTSSDITIRFNIIQCVASVFNFSGKGSNPTPNVTAARITAHDNYVPQINTAACNGDGIPIQLLTGVTDVYISHNTFLNSGASLEGVEISGSPAVVRPTITGNIFYTGDFGIHRDGGTPAEVSPDYTYNAIIGGNNYPFSCSVWPVGTTCPSTLAGVTGNGADGRPLGADMSAVNAQTAGVVVAP